MPTPSKRRIPDELRRRTQVSCDRCKVRRIKCIRSHQDESCRSCNSNGIACKSTLPRKHRIYGSVETLGARYQALDALVRGLFQDEDIDDTEELYRIAQKHNIPMPARLDGATSDIASQYSALPISPQSQHQQQHEDYQSRQTHVTQQQSSPIIYPSPIPSTNERPPPIMSSSITSTEIRNTQRLRQDVADENPFAQQPTPTNEEDLVPTPYGVWHYVGPSSSFKFATRVRSMVSRVGASTDGGSISGTGRGQGTRRQRRPHTSVWSEFTGPLTSKALEPRIADDDNVDTEHETRGGIRRPKSTPIAKHSTIQDRRQGTQIRLSEILPQRQVSDALIRTFFKRVHADYPIFHRGIFQLKYESIWQKHSENQDPLETGWACCLLLALSFGAQAHEHHDEKAKAQAQQIQRRSLSFVRARLHRLIGTTNLSNVQALLLLQLYEHNYGERNRAWMLLGAASRMAIALGMHREGPTASFDAIERNIRRRTWWTLYLFEQNLCIVLGRPSAIDDIEVSVSLPDEAMLDGGGESATLPGHLEQSLSLTQICGRIKRNIYPTTSLADENTCLPSPIVAHDLINELDTWYRTLPTHLSLESHNPLPHQHRAAILLHIAYYHARSLITRPYLLHKVDSEIARTSLSQTQQIEATVMELAFECQSSAREAMRLLYDMAKAGLVDGIGWYDVYYAYHGVLVLCLEFLIRPTSSRASPSPGTITEPTSSTDLHHLSLNKRAVVSVLEALRHERLSPTYHILLQVAVQFARIVNVVDEQTLLNLAASNGDRMQPQSNAEVNNSMLATQPSGNASQDTGDSQNLLTPSSRVSNTMESSTNPRNNNDISESNESACTNNPNPNTSTSTTNHVVDGWFQSHLSDPPWDFFNAGNYSYGHDDTIGNLAQLFTPAGMACTATFGSGPLEAFLDDDDVDFLNMQGFHGPSNTI